MGQELKGHRVAITGRLAALSRQAAAELIARRGGTFHSNLSRQTTILVVGREGWPLQSDGQVTAKLRRARQFRQQALPLQVVPEEAFLRSLELPHLASEVCQSYTVGELTRLLGVTRRAVEAWERAGLLSPTDAGSGIPCFDFRQVTAARSLIKLLEGGIKPQRLRRSLRQLRLAFPGNENSTILACLSRDGGKLVLRSEFGQLMETTGQLLMDFDEPGSATVPWTAAKHEDDLFEAAFRLEEEGQLSEAASYYRQILLEQGPDADVCFNLANVLSRMGQSQAAIERLHQAVTLDGQHVDAWNNLGNLLAKAERWKESCAAYRRALAIEPDYADAHYGLADVLEQLGLIDDARSHWCNYLEFESAGPWADYARQRLNVHAG